MNITRTAVAGALLAGASALAVTACAPTVSKTAATTAPPASFTPAPAPVTTSPAPVTTGPLGTSFTVTTTGASGSAVVYTVTLDKVDQHAALAPYESEDNPADHMAAARFTITGVTGQESDDANSDASAIGADTTEYSFSVNNVTDGPNFSSGEFEVGPGQSVSGWVSFEVPPGETVASVEWTPGLSGATATWTLGS